MIDTLYMANLIQAKLNQNNLGRKFLIFADEGDLVKSTRKGNYKKEYTHGILEIISDNIVPFEDLEFQTINTRLMLLVDLVSGGFQFETEEERNQSKNLIDIKQCVSDFINEVNGKSSYIDIDSKKFNLTITVNNPTNGQKTDLGEINEAFPIYINIQFVIFQNGLNSNYCKIIVNGESLGYTQLTKSKICTNNQSDVGKSGTRGYSLLGGKSFDFVVPLLESGVTQEFVEFMLNEEVNTAFNVRLEYPFTSKNFICILGKITETDTRGSNVALNVGLMQGVEDILNYDDRWTIKENVSGNETTIAELEVGDTVYWGDNTSTIINVESDKTHTYSDNKDIHTIRYFRKG